MENNNITTNTKIDVTVNGKHTFTIENNPHNGLHWITRSDMNREDYIQGLFAIAEAAYNMAIHKIKMDTERVINSKKAVDKG